jgi:L-rhamnose mutarotase
MSKIILGQLGRLKKDKIQKYEELHAKPWPEILHTIHECNLRNYSIFRHEDLVFAYFEYVGKDYEADMAKMEKDEATQRWWAFTKPCFEKFSFRPDSEFYADMKQIFYFE